MWSTTTPRHYHVLRPGDPRHAGRLALHLGLDELQEERRLDFAVGWVVPAVAALLRILNEVEELAIAGTAVEGMMVNWQFTTPDARSKLGRLYPS